VLMSMRMLLLGSVGKARRDVCACNALPWSPARHRHHGFVVSYEMGKDVSLGFHVDDAEVTLNLCLVRGGPCMGP
jgi:hypothetical protein